MKNIEVGNVLPIEDIAHYAEQIAATYESAIDDPDTHIIQDERTGLYASRRVTGLDRVHIVKVDTETNGTLWRMSTVSSRNGALTGATVFRPSLGSDAPPIIHSFSRGAGRGPLFDQTNTPQAVYIAKTILNRKANA